ncbi:hypothetical protein PMAYCL1PPCAC_01583, partial [Pristionchus mayeri]
MVNMQKENNERYTTLLERLAVTENRGEGGGVRETGGVTNPVGPTIDAIESRIVEFDYNEEECTFENWYERYRDVFEHDMKSLEEGMRVRILLRHLSVKCGTQYRDHKAHDDVMQVSFEDTVNALKSLFGKKESDFELRVRFFNQRLSTMGSTDVMKFASEVNRLYQKGNLKLITEDQMKITIFLAGLDLPNQKGLRAHLFNEVGKKPTITFNELLEKYSTMRALERDVTVVQKGATMMDTDEWVHVTSRPIRLVGNDWFFKLDLKRAFSEDENDTVISHIKSIPEFAKGDAVFYRDRDGPNREKWTEATVLKKMGRVLYEIQKVSGTTVVAHANQLKKRSVRDESDPLSVLIESFDLSRNVIADERMPTPPATPAMPTSPIRADTLPRVEPAKDAPTEKKTVIEPKKKDKKVDSQSEDPNPGRPIRVRKPPNRLTVTTTKGQYY